MSYAAQNMPEDKYYRYIFHGRNHHHNSFINSLLIVLLFMVVIAVLIWSFSYRPRYVNSPNNSSKTNLDTEETK